MFSHILITVICMNSAPCMFCTCTHSGSPHNVLHSTSIKLSPMLSQERPCEASERLGVLGSVDGSNTFRPACEASERLGVLGSVDGSDIFRPACKASERLGVVYPRTHGGSGTVYTNLFRCNRECSPMRLQNKRLLLRPSHTLCV